MHAYDRYSHRLALSREHNLRRGTSAAASLCRLKALGIPVEEQLAAINSCLSDIDQLLIPSTVNNLINKRFILKKEREIISILEEADPKALNYLIQHIKLGLLFYKVKDHRHFSGKHRTELIELLAVTRISVLNVLSRVNVLHAIQLMKLQAHTRSEHWVRNILLRTSQDDLSELKSLTDAKGDYFCMNQLIYNDIRSESVRQDILAHFKKEAAVQQAHMSIGTKKSKLRGKKAWRKILSDVDDTLYSSGGFYPAGVDKRFARKVIYPGVLAFYRELDLGTQGPEEWPSNAIGNLVFLSARPHLYKDVSEKHNFAKFEKLRIQRSMHTTPSLLAGDITSGREFLVQNDMGPLALKKYANFQRYVSIYPEFKHVFIGDNGQGDVKAGELMYDSFPKHFEMLYVHVVQDVTKTYGYDLQRWWSKGFRPCFFRTYPDAALHAASRKPPLIRISGLRRVCEQAVADFHMILPKQWPSHRHRRERREDLNQGIWRCNRFLNVMKGKEVPLIEAERVWEDGKKVRTPYGIGMIVSFDPVFDMYKVELDWRPLDIQVSAYKETDARAKTDASTTAKTGSQIVDNKVSSDSESDACCIQSEVDEESVNSLPIEVKVLNGEIPISNGNHSGDVKHLSVGSPSSPLRLYGDNSVASDVTDDGFALIAPSAVSSTTEQCFSLESRQQRSIPPLEPKVSKRKKPSNYSDHRTVTATLHRSDISKFTPPSLPNLGDRKQSGLLSFSFFASSETTKPKPSFNPGDKCATPYGFATIKEFRPPGTVIVEMTGWHAKAYLRKECIQIITKGIFSSLLRKFSNVDDISISSSSKKLMTEKLEFPYAVGTKIKTPFGEGVVTRPLPHPRSSGTPEKRKVTETSSLLSESPQSTRTVSTVGISVTSWTLADKTHPMVYCTPDKALEWINEKGGETSNILFSVLSKISAFKIGGRAKAETTAAEELKPIIYERYYKDGAAVSTAYGDGVVRSFRSTDGFYEVLLLRWEMANGSYAVGYLRQDALCHRIAKGCKVGHPVLTTYGLSGTLASIEPTTGVHIVTIPSAGAVCYLQPSAIVRPLKAAVGELVSTVYGEGVVRKYRAKDNFYEVYLQCGAMIYARGDSFERVVNGEKDSEGPNSIHWLWRYLGFASSGDKKANKQQRSRSNTITSYTRSIGPVNAT